MSTRKRRARDVNRLLELLTAFSRSVRRPPSDSSTHDSAGSRQVNSARQDSVVHEEHLGIFVLQVRLPFVN